MGRASSMVRTYSYLYGLGWFITARMVHYLDRQDLILSHRDLHKGPYPSRVAADSEKQLRSAVSPIDAQ